MKPSSPFFDAFISYGRADSKGFALKLYSRLKEAGFRIWFDQEDIPLAVDFQEQINHGIENTHNFLFIIAPHSVNSPYCLKEIELAIALNKRIIPLLHVEQIDRDLWQERNPSGTDEDWANYQAEGRHTSFQNIHPVIGKINWVYFREELDDFEVSLEGLISSINKHQDYVQRHTEYLDLALEWSRNQRRSQYLLTEEKRRQAASWLKYRFLEEQPPCIPTELHGEFICESIRQAQSYQTQTCLAYVQGMGDRHDELVQSIRRSLLLSGITIADNRVNNQTQKDFNARRRQKVDLSDNFIYFVTTESLKNEYCQQQLDYATAHHKRIIFIVLEPLEGDLYPHHREDIQAIDFIAADDPEKRQASIDSLLKFLDQDYYYHERHKYLLAKALNWQEQRQLTSLLLRGCLLQDYEDLQKISAQRKHQQFTQLQGEFLAASIEQATQETPIDVFLSYAPEDIDFATKLNETLEKQGKVTFFAEFHADRESEMSKDINRGLWDAANFIFIISPDSVVSSDCLGQFQRAQGSGKRLLGALCRTTPQDFIQRICADDQLIDFSRNGSDFYAGLSQLVRLLDTDKGHVESHTKWFRRAMEWERKKKTRDLLLRGSELAIAQYWLKESDKTQKRPEPTKLQREFIQSSVVESQKNIRRQKALFAAVSVGFVISTILGIVASRKSYEAAVSELGAIINTSAALFSSHNELDSFVEAMHAWRKSQNINLNRGDRFLHENVADVLSQSVYQLQESNRLSKHEAAVFAVDYNRDGDRLVSGSADKRIMLWSAQGELLQILGEVGPINKGHNGNVYAVQFSPNDQLIASASADRSIKLWELDQNGEYQFRRTIYGCVLETDFCNGHGGEVNTIAFSPNGEYLASASEDRSIKLWETDGEYITTVGEAAPDSQHQRAVNEIAFSPNGRSLISVSDDRSIKIWKRDFGQNNFTLRQTITGCRQTDVCDGHQDEVKGVAITPDGKMFVTVSDDKTVKIWNLEDGTLAHTLIGHTDEVEAVAIDTHLKGTHLIASVSRDKTVRLWNTEGTSIRTLPGHTSRIYDIAFKPNKAALASASRDRSIKLWRLNNEIVTPFYGHTSRVYAVTFSPDDQMIASAGRDRTVRLWNRQGRLLHTLTGHTAEIEKVVFSPDGRLLASASWDGTVKLWTIQGELLYTFEGHTKEVYGVEFSPDGTMIASLSADQTMKLWDLRGNEIQTIELNEGRVYDIYFSADGELIALAIGSTIQTLEKRGSGRRTYRIGKKIGGCQILDENCYGHGDDIEAIAITNDKEMIVSASRDSTVKFWDRAGHHLYTLRGHESEIEGLNLSADNKKLVSASRDSTLVIWENLPTIKEIRRIASRADRPIEYWGSNIKSQKNTEQVNQLNLESTVLKGHRAEVYAAEFNADGTMLISASADQSIILWDLEIALNLSALIDYGCHWTKDYLQHSDDEAARAYGNQDLCRDRAKPNISNPDISHHAPKAGTSTL
ncbi:TIR domain-containing protein [[Limnothrix rosea] IAM M-220]|uniref:TIR domain-containing protein n=1 Tax=[Limnothrix rosea] IAM M-220 TaxID=454133 RepID=UPI0009599B13|nr:TIR domain-containing protein [[Limnothrix rosea] IAM M-220]OKH17110.1 hypothetical protein NIES208_10515 [[Limnothrix rosea] IAM M-220]